MSARNRGHRRGGQNGRWRGWRGLGPRGRAHPGDCSGQRRGLVRQLTPKQHAYLRDLSRMAGEPFDPTLTRAEASQRIDELTARRPGIRPT
jgi:hypothetical protein